MKYNFGKIAIALTALAVLMGGYIGCDNSSSHTPQGNDSGEDSVAVKNVQDAGTECGALSPGQFCIAGMDFLMLGDSLVWNNNIVPSVEPISAKDTVFEEITVAEDGLSDTTSWFVKMMQYADGMLYLEQDFENPHLTGRIRIETSSYTHPTGLKVGSTVKDLKAHFNEIIPQPFPAYDVMDLVVVYTNGTMVFQVPLGDYYDPNQETYSLSDIPESSKVVRIVLM